MDAGAFLIVALFFGGGIFVAFICLSVATITRESEGTRQALYILAFLALLVQGGCWHMMGEIGRATGGENPGLPRIIFIAGGVAFVWAFILELRATNEWARKRREEKDRKRLDG